ncbi:MULTISPECIES: potassium channel family protein [Paraliobacillus]|uniref:potassium channel family protein n=1 Tax=Paraliobacillus TaxID=200903 RepID=UPI000DD2E60A|nr:MULTISPECIES: potassium channel family protein [Paraliobacillus]
MLAVVSITIILILMGASLYSFVFEKTYKRSYFSYEIFYALIAVYLTVLVSFGMIYFLLSFQGALLLEHGKLENVDILESLAHSLYFSGVTLMTVGYGDITPIGWARLLALVEAMVGYILPAAFFLKVWQQANFERTNKKQAKQKKLNNL